MVRRTSVSRRALCVPRRRRAPCTTRAESLRRKDHAQPVDREGHVARQRALAIADGLGHDARHPDVALDRRDLGNLAWPRAELGLEPTDRRELDVLLAERRQHLLDVAQEHGTRPDQQHALGGEAAAVRVEQVRGTVQRDRGLARARSSADHEDAGKVGPDRLVLLGLDRRDDVAHAPGAVAFERAEERAFAAHLETGRLGRVAVEHLVVERGDLASVAGDEVAAAHDAHRRDRRRPVERLGDRRPPVDHQRRVVGVLHREPPDVIRVAVLEIEPAEAERRLADVEVGEAALGDVVGDVALEPGLVRAARPDVGVRLPHPPGRPAHRLEPRVGRVEVGLFALDFRVSDLVLHHARLPMGEERVYPGAFRAFPAAADPYP